MPALSLPERGVVRVRGAEARAFLDGLVTCDLDRVGPARPRFGALLSPQGKILFDFLVWQEGEDSFLLDAPRVAAPDLAKRLAFYRLRAKIVIEDASEELGVGVGWDGEGPALAGPLAATDPRLDRLGRRVIRPRPEIEAGPHAPEIVRAHRIRLGVPEAGQDFLLGDLFPHEALMDQLHGVDFDKGCYVGQEVVSRMHHRGTARSRIVPLVFPAGAAPEPGAEVKAGGRAIGRTGSGAGDRCLALLRLDRAAEALAAAEPLQAGGLAAVIELPDWATFTLPAPSG